ncbi:MAG: hypothetical protein KDB94_06850 [Acidobacteria bacterium]|nr:hypothetical protein [Acidobacteriota bacterium]MCB9378238.1 hypothetical protein [Holophagales bacterium]
MGLLDRLFGGSEPQHPPLEAGTPLAARLDTFSGELEQLAGSVRDTLEAVPEREALFVFVGHPPKGFGVVRYGPEGESNLIQVMREAKLPPTRVQEVSDQARQAYVAHQEAPRFALQVGKRAVTVIDSEPLGEKLDAVFTAARG